MDSLENRGLIIETEQSHQSNDPFYSRKLSHPFLIPSKQLIQRWQDTRKQVNAPMWTFLLTLLSGLLEEVTFKKYHLSGVLRMMEAASKLPLRP